MQKTHSEFAHEKLDAYQLARQLAIGCREVVDDLPSGFGRLKDQLRRSSCAVPLLVAEAANRRSRAQKRQRFEEAMGEAAECAAAIEVACDLGACSPERAAALREIAIRVVSMLAKLERKFR